MKKYLLIFVTVVLVLGGGYYYFGQRPGEVEIPKTTTAVKKNLAIELEIDGQVVHEVYEPAFAIAGKVQSVLVKEGQVVKKGQWLATLDVTEAQKNLEKTLRDYAQARNDFDEDDQVTYEDKTVVTDTIKRILSNNQGDLDKAVLDVELKNLALNESRLKAPVAGIVARVEIKVGDYVSTQNQTGTVVIAPSAALIFEANAEESDLLSINEEQTVEITLDSYPKEPFAAKLLFVSPIAERDSSGIVSYPIKAQIVIDSDKKVLDGMEGALRFITKEVKGVIAIPNTSVYRENNESYVDLWEDNKIIKTKVVTGFTNGKEVEVVSGIASGANVVTKK